MGESRQARSLDPRYHQYRRGKIPIYGALLLLVLPKFCSNSLMCCCFGFVQDLIRRNRRRNPFSTAFSNFGQQPWESSGRHLLHLQQQPFGPLDGGDSAKAARRTFGVPTPTRKGSMGCLFARHDTELRSNPDDDDYFYYEQEEDNNRDNRSDLNNNNEDDTREWKAVMAAFQMYKAAYGNLKIPQRFVVPNMKPWPKVAWGMRLGKVVQNIRSTGKYIQQNRERRRALENLGFIWQVRAQKQPTAAASATLEQVYKALSVYADLHNGNINVPLAFVVPTTEPWPESVKELPLGRQLVSFLPKALEEPENDEWKLKFAQLGFPTTALSSSSSSATATSTSTWSSSFDNDDEPLGNANDNNKWNVNSSDISGQVMSANDFRFQKVYAALEAYKRIHGDLLVPQPFVVPKKSPDWPPDTWGLRLGARVNAIRSQGTFVNKNPERKQLLDDMGFAWNPPRSEQRRRRRKSQNDDDDDNEQESSEEEEEKEDKEEEDDDDNDDIGFDVDSFREDNDNGDDELSSLFDKPFDLKEFSMDGDKVKPAWGFEGGGNLQELARQQSQLERKEEDYTPERTLAESMTEARARAKEVGIIEGITANNRVIKGKREKDIPWFNDDFGDDFVFDDVLEALTLYKSLYGDFSNITINFDFVVPSATIQTGFIEDEDDDMMMFDVDASARAARAIAKFEELGDYDRSEDLIAAEIKRLQQQVGGAEARESYGNLATTKTQGLGKGGEWPEHLSGMQLGFIVKRIRDGSLEVKHLPERKAKLDALGFDWGDDRYFIDVPFEKAMCAMYAYYLVRGDMFVYEDFVLPNDDPWPEALAGFEIGKAVKRIRELQNFLEAYHPEKVSLLRMIDFVWFPTVAVPIDPDETEMDDEMLRLTAMGHPDYAKMLDIPMGLPDKIIADGPFYETDDPKLWWRKWHNWDYVKDYWYEQGRRDNAFILRNLGYKRMAEEHEAKYGPGLFKQMEWTMASLSEEGILKKKTLEEKKKLLSTLSYYRQEMMGCTDIHPEDRANIMEDLDQKMMEIMKESNLEFDDEEDEDEDDDDEENDTESENDQIDNKTEYEDSDVEYDYPDNDYDVEGELGLKMR